MDEKVDILLATYNGERYLKEQLDSILNQTYKNIRIIISDDCSKDGTRDILKEYEKNENIKVYYQENNLGYVKNFEFLLSKVQSDIYMLSDQDDIWKEEKVEKSVEKLKEGNFDLVFGDLEVVDENLNTIQKSYNTYMHLMHRINTCIKDYRLQYLYNCMTGCTIIAKKDFLQKVLPFPTDSKYLIHDYWLGLITSIYGKVGYLSTPYILYRQHTDNQVGISKASHKFKKLGQVRELSLEIKLGIFETYLKHEEVFPEDLRKQNRQAYDYFKMLETKKYINFKGWGTFNKIFKGESVYKYLENFMTLNMPIILSPFFKLRYLILKILGKR